METTNCNDLYGVTAKVFVCLSVPKGNIEIMEEYDKA